MVYDSDMLLLTSNDDWWDILEKHDVFLTSEVLDYRNNIIKDTKLRKVFTENSLPNVYFGFHYFKKTKRAYEFYKWLEVIVKNYKVFYKKFTGFLYPFVHHDQHIPTLVVTFSSLVNYS